MSQKKKITLIDVAKHAGVSRATASLVLRNSPLVADDTRAQVLDAMNTLGYVYNRAAANLRSRQSHIVGLVVTDITNPFFAELATHIEAQLEEENYAVFLSNTRDQQEKQHRLLQALHGHQIDGLLLCPAEGTDWETIEMLQRWHLPVVMIARYLEESQSDYAGANNQLGAEMAVDHLVANGHRRIAFLGGRPQSSARKDRYQGYQNALKQHHIPLEIDLSITSPVSREGGFKAMLHILDQPEAPSAALCYNDVVAFGAMLALQSRNLTPGKDFAIVGFDDIADAALVRPALTTVSITPREIGQAAIDLLMRRMADPSQPPEIKIIPPRMVIRQSSTS